MTQHKFKTVNLRGKEYVEVNQRILYFRTAQEFKDWSLETEIISSTADSVIMRAVARNPEGRIIATGFAQEDRTSSVVNKTSFVENCETSCWGRCMANLGIGISPEIGIASADEVVMAIEKEKLSMPKQPAKPAKPTPTAEVKAEFENVMGLETKIDDVIEFERLREQYIKLLQEYHHAGGIEPLPSSQGLSKERLEAGIQYIQQALGHLKAGQ